MTLWEWLVNIFGKPPKPPTPPVPSSDLVTLHNQFRVKNGLSVLTVDPRLMKSAQAHSEDMAKHNRLSHTGSDGSSPFERMTRAGYTWSAAAENVAAGQTNATDVMLDWINDPPHKRDILGPYKNIGVGRSGTYWTVDFGTLR